MSDTEQRLAVERGAALLDEKRPGWAKLVKVGILRMDSCERCILGQLAGQYLTGLTGLFGYDAPCRFGEQHGFDAPDFDYESDGELDLEYLKLAALWREQIAARTNVGGGLLGVDSTGDQR